MNKVTYYLAATALMTLCLLIGYKTGYNRAKMRLKPIIEEYVHYDTITVYKPQISHQWYGHPMLIPYTDTMVITKHDTSYVSVPREYKEYSDSTYRAVVSGYDPSLDFIETYSKTITRNVTRTEWYKGTYFAADFQARYDSSLSMPFLAKYGWMNKHLDANIGIGFDVAQNEPIVGIGVSYKFGYQSLRK